MHWLDDYRREPQCDFDAPYQRGSVWTEEQRRELIKSLLMGLPIGAVIVSALPPTSPVHYRVVDGKQRLLAIRAFAADEFGIPAEWVDPSWIESSNAESTVTWSDLSHQGQHHIENLPVMGLEFDAYREFIGWEGTGAKRRAKWRVRTEEEAIRAEAEVYRLINFTGVAQTDEDARRAAAVAAS